MHSFRDRVSELCSFLRWFGLFITSDWVFLVVGIFFLRLTGSFCILLLFGLFIWLLITGVKKYSQNKCHLAAKLGTKLADLL